MSEMEIPSAINASSPVTTHVSHEGGTNLSTLPSPVATRGGTNLPLPIIQLVDRSVHPDKTPDQVINRVPHLRQYWDGHYHGRIPTSRQLFQHQYFSYLVVAHLQEPRYKVVLDQLQHSQARLTGVETFIKGHLRDIYDRRNLGDVVVKYRDTREHHVLHELQILCELRRIGCPLFWFSSSFMFWTSRVLVREVS